MSNTSKKAMIFAAGLGTRLRPLTNDRPKALVEINQKPLLGHTIDNLTAHGFSEIIVNVHHFADKVISFLQNYPTTAQIRVSDETGLLLETGGGLKKAVPMLLGDGPVLVCNVDVLSDLDLNELWDFHEKNNALATLAIRDRITSRYLLWDDRNRLCGWENTQSGEQKLPVSTESPLKRRAFSGIQILSQEFLNSLTETGKFSIIDPYLRLAPSLRIFGYDHSDGFWLDVGKPESLEKGKVWMKESKQGKE